MAVSLTRFPWLFWRGKEKDSVTNGSTRTSPPPPPPYPSDWGFGLREPEKTVKTPPFKGSNIASPPRKVKRKWQSREEWRIDREFDVVLVPADGVCVPGSESDDSDWSIGWMEPHPPDFQGDDEDDSSFAVLVPCYRLGSEGVLLTPNNQLLSTMTDLASDYSEGKNQVELWLSSLQNC